MKNILGIIHFKQVTRHEEQIALSLECPELLQSTRPDEWGNVFFYNSKDIGDLQQIGSFIYQVVVTSQMSEDSYEENIKKLFHGVNAWRAQLYEKVSLARKNCPISPETDYFERGGIATGFELYAYDAEDYSQINTDASSMTFDLYFIRAEHALQPEELQEILNAIDTSKHLKVEYEMLMNAFFEQEKGNTRYAIMEATAAVELCVSQKIKDRCDALGIDGKGLCDAFYRSLGDRFNLLKHLGIEMATKDPSKELIKPRNDLFHNRTLMPTPEVCEKVLESAEAYLRSYTPQMYE